MQMKWSKEYKVGVKSIDEQHRHLINLINEFESARTQGRGRHALNSILVRMIVYFQKHFQAEERMLSQLDDPLYSTHKSEHRKLAAKIIRFQAQFSQGQTDDDEALSQFLKHWLNEHITTADKQIGPHIQRKNAN